MPKDSIPVPKGTPYPYKRVNGSGLTVPSWAIGLISSIISVVIVVGGGLIALNSWISSTVRESEERITRQLELHVQTEAQVYARQNDVVQLRTRLDNICDQVNSLQETMNSGFERIEAKLSNTRRR